jgi:O-methyltransferase
MQSDSAALRRNLNAGSTVDAPDLDPAHPGVAEAYIDLLKKCLTGAAFPEALRRISPRRGTAKRAVVDAIGRVLARRGLTLAKLPAAGASAQPDPQTVGLTMMGLPRLNHLQDCIETVIRQRVPGDFIETGVWRGGAVIFMRAMLKVHRQTRRSVWVADSFQGLPKPDSRVIPRTPAISTGPTTTWPFH